MGQILAKILSEKYGVLIFFALAIYVLNNWSSSSSTAPPSGPCDAGLTLCNTDCVNLQTDASNCGSCGNDLASILPNAVCSSGVVQCASTFTDCGVGGIPDCVNTNTNILHCGGCNQTSQNATCVSGNFVCEEAFAKCGGVECSINLNTDPDNCGSCDNTINIDGLEAPTCVGGIPTCPNLTYCEFSGGCVDIDNDPYNCGSCGVTSDNAQFCIEGELQCFPSFETCNTSPPCSIQVLGSDVNNCGGCGQSVIQYNGAQDENLTEIVGSCVDGVKTCSSELFTYCENADLNVGCTNLQTNVNHCGQCFNAIDINTASCVDGEIRCIAPLTLCGTECVNLLTDPNHCSVCDLQCPSGTPNCVDATCIDINNRSTCGLSQIDCLEFSEHGGAAYAQCCNQQCTHTGLDFNNCGSCGNVCDEFPGGQCINGVCFYP